MMALQITLLCLSWNFESLSGRWMFADSALCIKKEKKKREKKKKKKQPTPQNHKPMQNINSYSSICNSWIAVEGRMCI